MRRQQEEATAARAAAEAATVRADARAGTLASEVEALRAQRTTLNAQLATAHENAARESERLTARVRALEAEAGVGGVFGAHSGGGAFAHGGGGGAPAVETDADRRLAETLERVLCEELGGAFGL